MFSGQWRLYEKGDNCSNFILYIYFYVLFILKGENLHFFSALENCN